MVTRVSIIKEIRDVYKTSLMHDQIEGFEDPKYRDSHSDYGSISGTKKDSEIIMTAMNPLLLAASPGRLAQFGDATELALVLDVNPFGDTTDVDRMIRKLRTLDIEFSGEADDYYMRLEHMARGSDDVVCYISYKHDPMFGVSFGGTAASDDRIIQGISRFSVGACEKMLIEEAKDAGVDYDARTLPERLLEDHPLMFS